MQYIQRSATKTHTHTHPSTSTHRYKLLFFEEWSVNSCGPTLETPSLFSGILQRKFAPRTRSEPLKHTPTHALRLCPQWKYIPAVFGYRNTRFRTPTNRSFAWIFFFQNGVLLELTTHQEDYIAVWTSFLWHLSAWSSRCSFFRRIIGMQVKAKGFHQRGSADFSP